MNRQPRKGQTSLDFLMTYGWAVLLVVVVVASLFALGVFNAGSFMGPRATGFAQIGVIAWNVNAAGILSLRVQNFAGMDISIIGIDASYGTSNYSFPITNVSIPNSKISDTFTVGAISSLAPGQYYTLPLRITYVDLNGFNYTETGTISGTVGAGAVPPSVRINSPHSDSILNNRTIDISLTVTGANLNQTDISIANGSGVVDSTTNSSIGTYSVQLSVQDDGVYNITAIAYYNDGSNITATASNITVNVSAPAGLQCSDPLDIPNHVYTMTDDVSSGGTCFTIAADNITLDCNGRTITGPGTSSGNGIYVPGYNYTTVENCNVTRFNNGIVFSSASYGTIQNNTASSNIDHGIALYSGSNNTVAGNNIINNPNNNGFWIQSSSNNTIANNTFSSNAGGIALMSGSLSNVFYNNLFNQSYPVYSNDGSINAWNTTLDCSVPGANIIGGDCIGGNFWAQPDGNGWSENPAQCNANASGICAAPYSVPYSVGTDYLPLTNLLPPPPTELSDCGNISYSGNYVLAGDVSNSGTCFTIEADDVTLDCQGNRITGNSGGSGVAGNGIYLNGNDSVVENCNISGFQSGAYVASASGDTLQNNYITATGYFSSSWGNSYGIYLSSSSGNTVQGNQIASSTTTNYGAYGIYLGSSSGNTVQGNYVTSNGLSGAYGIFLSSSYSNSITANSISPFGGYYYGPATSEGIHLTSSQNNTLQNNSVNATGYGSSFGINLDSSSNNTLLNNLLYPAGQGGYFGTQIAYGVYFSNSNNNSISGTIANANNGGYASGYGIYFTTSVGNLLYNNFMNDTVPAWTDGTSTNAWNATLDCGAGPNIIGGDCMGGNYYATPGGNGWSQNNSECNANITGVCTSPYVINGSADTDYLPLTNLNQSFTYLSSCGNISYPSKYILTGDVSNTTGDCFDITADNVTLDCVGNSISGGGSGDGIDNTAGHSNVTIRNCVIAGFHYGIDFENGASYGTIENNIASSNSYGIVLWSSSSNTLSNNIADSNGGYGIVLYIGSNYNTLSNNTASSNSNSGIRSVSSSSNTLSNNIASSNGNYGILLDGGNNNTFVNNTASNNPGAGFYLTGSSGNWIYNNFLNDTIPAYTDGSGLNLWNSTANGNYYATPTDSGFSQTDPSCTGSTTGICGSPYNIDVANGGSGTNDVDYLPLALPPVSLSSCGRITTSGYYRLLSNISNSTATCLNITASRVILDCRGYSIAGGGVGDGIYLNGNDSTIENCQVHGFGYGVYLDSSSHDTLSNITAYSNNGGQSVGGYGIYLSSSSHDILSGINSYSNNGGRYGPGGFGIYLSSSNNDTLSNITANSNAGDYNANGGYGVYLSSSNNNTLSNVSANGNGGNTNGGHGIYLSSSNNNTLSNVSAAGSGSYIGYAAGIELSASSGNTITAANASSNAAGNAYPGQTGFGVYINSGSNDNTIEDSVMSWNHGNQYNPPFNGYGVYVSSSSGNTITSNIIDSNYGSSNGIGCGVSLSGSSGNYIYNNFLNDTIPAQADSNANYWNATLTVGTNIINGLWIGGNYYAQPDGNGWSQNSTECNANDSGICTSNYTINNNNFDQLPLTNLTPLRTAVDNFVWVTNSGDNTVSKIDKTTDTVSGLAIDVGNGPYGLAVDPDYVWTANNGGTTVSKVNKTTGAVEANITVGPNPGGIAVDHDYVWVSYGSGGTSAVSKVNRATGSVDANITVGLSPYGVAVDSNYVWIANGADGTVSKIDKSNDSVVATITVSDQYTYPALIATDSAYVWVTISGSTNVSKIAKTNDSVVATIDVGSSPYGVAVDQDYVWVATCGANSVVKISKSNDSIVDTITAVGVCPSGMSLDEDYVWAVSQNSNSVYKIDKSNDSVVATIPMGAGTYPASEGDATGYSYDMFFH